MAQRAEAPERGRSFHQAPGPRWSRHVSVCAFRLVFSTGAVLLTRGRLATPWVATLRRPEAPGVLCRSRPQRLPKAETPHQLPHRLRAASSLSLAGRLHDRTRTKKHSKSCISKYETRKTSQKRKSRWHLCGGDLYSFLPVLASRGTPGS